MLWTHYVLLSFIPFLILDLTLSILPHKCSHTPIITSTLPFPLSTWLLISFLSNLPLVLFPLLLYWLRACANTLVVVAAFYALLWTFFRFAWLVIGAVMFFGFLWPNGKCDRLVELYMWVNLLVGVLQLVILMMLQGEIRAEFDWVRTRQRVWVPVV